MINYTDETNVDKLILLEKNSLIFSINIKSPVSQPLAQTIKYFFNRRAALNNNCAGAKASGGNWLVLTHRGGPQIPRLGAGILYQIKGYLHYSPLLGLKNALNQLLIAQ